MNNLTSVKAKFLCQSVTDYGKSKEIKMGAVYGKEGENADFTKYTPVGNLNIYIEKDAPASNYFNPGKEYYLTFDAAE